MGDRCYVYVHCRESDREVVNDTIYGEGCEGEDETGHDEIPGWCGLGFEECNYAATGPRDELLKRGIPFYGSHCAGGDYGAGAFACDGECMMDVETDHDGFPVARVGDDGNVDANSLATVRRYQVLEARAKAAEVGEYVIAGPRRFDDEADEDDRLYWSNEDGWVVFPDATRFTVAERDALEAMPINHDDELGSEWKPLQPPFVLDGTATWEWRGNQEILFVERNLHHEIDRVRDGDTLYRVDEAVWSKDGTELKVTKL